MPKVIILPHIFYSVSQFVKDYLMHHVSIDSHNKPIIYVYMYISVIYLSSVYYLSI